MMAAAAVGGSHLVASNQSRSHLWLQLAALIILVNLFKYPFFVPASNIRFGVQSLVEGYSNRSPLPSDLFDTKRYFSRVVNTAALLLFSASLLSYFIPFELATSTLCMIVPMTRLIILFAGHYRALDTLSKAIAKRSLRITTLSRCRHCYRLTCRTDAAFVPPSPWSLAAIGFIVVTMGGCLPLLRFQASILMWLKSRKRNKKSLLTCLIRL